MDKKTIAAILLQTYPFLKPLDINQLIQIGDHQVYKNKAVIISAQTTSKKIFFLLSGMVRGYFINRKGEEKNIFLRPEHTITGAPDSLFNNQPSKYTFESILESHLFLFHYDELLQVSRQFPNINQLLIVGLQENIQTLIFRVESLIDKLPEERYEELLERSPQFFQTAFNKHIANYLGITPNSLSRIVKRRKENHHNT